MHKKTDGYPRCDQGKFCPLFFVEVLKTPNRCEISDRLRLLAPQLGRSPSFTSLRFSEARTWPRLSLVGPQRLSHSLAPPPEQTAIPVGPERPSFIGHALPVTLPLPLGPAPSLFHPLPLPLAFASRPTPTLQSQAWGEPPAGRPSPDPTPRTRTANQRGLLCPSPEVANVERLRSHPFPAESTQHSIHVSQLLKGDCPAFLIAASVRYLTSLASPGEG